MINWIAGFSVFFWSLSALSDESFDRARGQIVSRLRATFSSPKASALLDKSDVIFQAQPVESKMLNVLKVSQPFGTYTDRKSIKRCRRFVQKHRKAFEAASNESGVEASVITAILYVETRFGKYHPRYRVFDTLMSLAALGEAPLTAEIAEQAEAAAMTQALVGPMIDWNVRAKRVGDEWFAELSAFVKLCESTNWSCETLKGSWAGALGFGQFMPTTALRNMTEPSPFQANLFHWDDVIRLVGRHLKENGWSPLASDEKRREAILKYNRLDSYANAVLSLAGKLNMAQAVAERSNGAN